MVGSFLRLERIKLLFTIFLVVGLGFCFVFVDFKKCFMRFSFNL